MSMSPWRRLEGRSTAWFSAPSHAAGAALLGRVTELVGPGAGPDVDVRAAGVRVALADDSHADAVADAASRLGLVAEPAVLQRLSVVIEARDPVPVRSFWRTVTAYGADGGDLVDPLRRDPRLRVRETTDHRPLRNRLHLDVPRPHELGRLTADTLAPGAGRDGAGWRYHATLADPEGNEVDLIPLVPDDRFEDGTGTDDWRLVFGAMAFYPVDDLYLAADLVTEVAALADTAGLGLMVDVRPEGVTVDSGKDLWEADGFVALAAAVQEAARRRGLAAAPSRLRFVQVGIDAVDVPVVREFWRVVLGYVEDPREGLTDVVDRRLLGMPLFFQPMGASDTGRIAQRNRIHLELSLPADEVRARLALAVAHGGRVLEEDPGSGAWRVADPEGNELQLRAG